jgi:hypothetical protein
MAQEETPFTPEAVDTQVEALEAALQFEPSDHPKTANMQVIAALHDVYTAERQAYNASLRQVRQHLLRESRAASQARPHLQEARAMPGIPSERRRVMNHPLRSFPWRGGLLTRFSTIAAALALTLLVGGLIAGLILVRHGNGGTTQTGQGLSGGTEVRLQTACPIPNQQCTPYEPALLPTERAILEHRLQDALGSSSWTISLEGNNTLVVDLPPMAQTQEQATIGLLDQTGLLQILDTGAQSLPVNQPVPAGVTYPVPFTGQDLDTSSIQATLDPVSGQPVLLFEFKPQKRSAFASYTEAHIGEFLTIALDGIVIESAVIQSQITGQAEIAGGGRTLAQDQHIAVLLRSGPLPVPLTVVSTQPISSTPGHLASLT